MFQDPKYVITAVNRATGKLVPRHIPVMLLVAKDLLAADTINHYADAADENGLPAIAASARERVQAFATFAAEYPAQMKLPDGTAVSALEAATPPTLTGMTAMEAPYLYTLSGGNVVQFLKPSHDGTGLLPGTTTEEVMEMLIDRIRAQERAVPAAENADILLHLGTALARHKDRMTRMAGAIAQVTASDVEIFSQTGVEQFGIRMIECASSNLEAYGYRASDQTMALRFRGGRIYHYRQVPPAVALGIVSSESKGAYASSHVIGKFEGERQDAQAQQRA